MEKTIRQRLNLSVVKFAFKKKNGEVRYATGTTNIPLLNELFDLKIEEKEQVEQKSNGTTPYFDLGKMGWRCFKNDTIIEIIND
tara:strand:- start:214 stop:465 length:252 start_codon:yes stop_codon:yes gene_type:complete